MFTTSATFRSSDLQYLIDNGVDLQRVAVEAIEGNDSINGGATVSGYRQISHSLPRKCTRTIKARFLAENCQELYAADRDYHYEDWVIRYLQGKPVACDKNLSTPTASCI